MSVNKLDIIVIQLKELDNAGNVQQRNWRKGCLLREARAEFPAEQDFGKWRSAKFADLATRTANDLMKLGRLKSWEMVKPIGMSNCYKLTDSQVAALNAAFDSGSFESEIATVLASLSSKPKATATSKKPTNKELTQTIAELTKQLEIANSINAVKDDAYMAEDGFFSDVPMIREAQFKQLSKSINYNAVLFGFAAGVITPIPEKELRARYKKLAHQYHPDTRGSDAEMQYVNRALKVVKLRIEALLATSEE